MDLKFAHFAADGTIRDPLEALFAAFLDYVPIGMGVTEIETGRFLHVNKHLCEITGYTEAQLLGLRVWDITHPDEQEANFRDFRRLGSGELSEYVAEKRYVRPDRASVWVRVTARAVQFDGARRIVGAIEDVSQRKHVEEERDRFHSQIENQHQLFQSVVENVPAGLAVLEGPHHHYVLVNPAQKAIAPGNDDLIGRTVADVWQDAMGHEAQRLLDDVYESGIPVYQTDMPLLLDRGDGIEEAFFNLDYLPLRNSAGCVTGILLFSTETTEQVVSRRRIEELARHAEVSLGKLDAVFRSLAEGVIVLDLKGDVLEINPAASRILGFDGGAQAVCSVRELSTAVELLDLDGMAIPHTEWPLARILRGQTFTDYEMEVRRSGEQESMIVNCAGALARNAAGEPILGVLTVRDVTAGRRAEAALRRSEALYRGIARNIRDGGVWVVDRHLRYQVAEGSLIDSLGLAREHMEGRTVRELFNPDEARVIESRFSNALRGETASYEMEYRGHFLLSRYAPLHDEGGRVVGAMVLAFDITDRKRAEEALRDADRRKDEFLAMLAHELRNPLAAISNAAAIMTRLPLSDRRLVQVRDIVDRQSHHLARLVDDLLDVSRITQGKVALRKEKLVLSELLARAIDTARPLIATRRHELRVLMSPEPIWVEGDEVRIVQIVGNLLNNAAKYTLDGGWIGIETGMEEDEAVVRVSDSGEGIDPELLPHVFDLFIQAQRGPDRSEGGLGIGLTIVKMLVEMHGGSVRVESQPGRGSTFEVRLPRMAGSGAAGTVLPAQSHIAPLNVLVVDDNTDAAESLAVLLRLIGHRVETAANAQEGIETALRFRPSVMMLDIGLPGIDGYELCRRLRSMPETRDATIVAISGYAAAEDGPSKQAGFDRYLVKPVDFGTLTEILGVASGG